MTKDQSSAQIATQIKDVALLKIYISNNIDSLKNDASVIKHFVDLLQSAGKDIKQELDGLGINPTQYLAKTIVPELSLDGLQMNVDQNNQNLKIEDKEAEIITAPINILNTAINELLEEFPEKTPERQSKVVELLSQYATNIIDGPQFEYQANNNSSQSQYQANNDSSQYQEQRANRVEYLKEMFKKTDLRGDDKIKVVNPITEKEEEISADDQHTIQMMNKANSAIKQSNETYFLDVCEDMSSAVSSQDRGFEKFVKAGTFIKEQRAVGVPDRNIAYLFQAISKSENPLKELESVYKESNENFKKMQENLAKKNQNDSGLPGAKIVDITESVNAPHNKVGALQPDGVGRE